MRPARRNTGCPSTGPRAPRMPTPAPVGATGTLRAHPPRNRPLPAFPAPIGQRCGFRARQAARCIHRDGSQSTRHSQAKLNQKQHPRQAPIAGCRWRLAGHREGGSNPAMRDQGGRLPAFLGLDAEKSLFQGQRRSNKPVWCAAIGRCFISFLFLFAHASAIPAAQPIITLQPQGKLVQTGASVTSNVARMIVTTALSPSDLSFRQVAAGSRHTMAIKRNGTLWAWGRNHHGQLGDGTTVNRNSPVQVGSAANWQLVVAGWSHTVAMKGNGTLWAWGNIRGISSYY